MSPLHTCVMNLQQATSCSQGRCTRSNRHVAQASSPASWQGVRQEDSRPCGPLLPIQSHSRTGRDNLDSAEEPLWQKSDSEKDHLRCIPRPFKSTTDEISA